MSNTVGKYIEVITVTPSSMSGVTLDSLDTGVFKYGVGVVNVDGDDYIIVGGGFNSTNASATKLI